MIKQTRKHVNKYVNNAPKDIVEKERKTLETALEELKELEQKLK